MSNVLFVVVGVLSLLFVRRLPFVKASSVSYAILKLFSYVSFQQKGAELSKFTTLSEKSQLLQNCN